MSKTPMSLIRRCGQRSSALWALAQVEAAAAAAAAAKAGGHRR